jgi:hypothetical protein
MLLSLPARYQTRLKGLNRDKQCSLFFSAPPLGGRRGRAALADDDGDSDLDERFGNLGVRYAQQFSSQVSKFIYFVQLSFAGLIFCGRPWLTIRNAPLLTKKSPLTQIITFSFLLPANVAYLMLSMVALARRLFPRQSSMAKLKPCRHRLVDSWIFYVSILK